MPALNIDIGVNTGQSEQKLKALQNGFAQTAAEANKTGADFAQSSNSLNALGQRAAVLQGRIASLQRVIGNTSDYTRLTKATELLKRSQSELSSINLSSSFTKTAQGAQSATLALTNVGRVAQDLPFGFIGIANNLNPLLESFQRLKAETGSTGGALKALGSSLIGAGGLGIALSAVTAAFTFASIGLQAWGKGMGGAKSAADEAKKSNQDFAKSLNDAKSAAISQGLQLQQYAAIARDVSKTDSERTLALNEVNKILGDHAEKLDLVTISTDKGKTAINNYTEALIQQAVASKYSDRAAEIFIKQTDAVKKLNEEQKKLTELSNKVNGPLDTTGSEAAAERAARIEREYEKQKKKVQEASDAVTQLGGEYRGLTTDLNKATTEANKLLAVLSSDKPVGKIAELEKKIKDLKDKRLTLKTNLELKDNAKQIQSLEAQLKKYDIKVGATVDKKGVASVINELNASLSALDEQKKIGIDIDLNQEKIKAIESTIKELTEKFGLKADNPIVLDLKVQLDALKLQSRVTKEVDNEFKKIEVGPQTLQVPTIIKLAEKELPGDKEIAELNKNLDYLLKQGLDLDKILDLKVKIDPNSEFGDFVAELSKSLQKQLKMFQQSAKEAFEDFFASIGQGLGTGSLKDAFSGAFASIFKSLGGFVRKLGIESAAVQKLIVSLKNTFGTITGIGKAIALIVLGSAIQAFAGKLSKGFATGGYVSGPGTKTSDSIPARLSRGEYVVRAAAVDKYGVKFLNALNKGALEDSVPLVNRTSNNQFSRGGLVDYYKKYYGDSVPLVNRMSNDSVPLVNRVSGDSVPLVNRMSNDSVPLVNRVSNDSVPLVNRVSNDSGDSVPLVNRYSNDRLESAIQKGIKSYFQSDSVPLVNRIGNDSVPLVNRFSNSDSVPLVNRFTSVPMPETQNITSKINPGRVQVQLGNVELVARGQDLRGVLKLADQTYNKNT